MPNSRDTGFKTLEVISRAKAFNEWMYKTIQPHCHGNILEIGSGIGNISKHFIADGAAITLSDTDNFYVQILKDQFPGTNILSINLEHPGFYNEYKDLLSQYDTVFLLNVLEHIKNDEEAIRNCCQLLKPQGTLVILVPSYPFLYSAIDKGLSHYRRYTRKSLTNLILKNDFTIQKTFHFNALGVAGWMYAKLLGLKKISSRQMKLYNRVTGFAEFLDKLLIKKIGLSIVTIAKKSWNNS